MAKLFVLATVLWPAALGAAVWARATHQPSEAAGVIYLAGSRVCHQRPERSFETAGVPWPVCGRCTGLYLAAPFGAMLGLRRRDANRSGRRLRMGLVLAAIPTVVTLALEAIAPALVNNAIRATAALPLGVMVAAALGQVVAGTVRPTDDPSDKLTP
jgi:uncharacterized membrane protein